MNVEDLPIPERAKEVIRGFGIDDLYPPQEEGVEDVLSGKNCVFALPTASGKSLLAYLAIIRKVLEEGGKALYIVPLRALASEKYDELKSFEKLGLRVAISMGDYDNPDPNLKYNDIIIATSEKADSLLRQNVDWLDQLNLMIADEVHLINDRERGSTLEITLAKLKQVNPDAQIVALSATINNSETLANWLGAEHHKSEWRPVELREGVFYQNRIQFSDGDVQKIEDTRPVPGLCCPIINNGGQCLVFVGTRRSTEAVAQQMARDVEKYLDEDEKKLLKMISDDIKDDSRTSLGKRLAEVVESGSAFHNAGLNNYQRKKVEKAFKSGHIKMIAATPTLAAGINMPARRVIIRDCRRYDPMLGYNAPLPVLEVKQMAGRAGRPGYDDIGEAILVAKREKDARNYFDNYILGDSEDIISRMATEPALRKHLLALIATSHCTSEKEIFDFMRETFYAQMSDVWMIEERVNKTLELLEKKDFISREEGLRATRFGKRVSDVYIDPLSAVEIRKAVDSGKTGMPLSYLHIICMTPDMYNFYIKKSEIPKYIEKIEAVRADLFVDLPMDEVEQEDFLACFKTALMLQDWMNEIPEEEIAETYSIGPGDIRNKVETAEWLLHAASEVATLFNRKKADKLRTLRERVKHGVLKELIPLMELRQVGRVRARTFYDAGYKSAKSVKKADPDELKKLSGIGDKIVKIIKKEEEEGSNQASLSEF
ncbi:MAG: DEAD/DEAH box helicase [Thermoplasmatota archaeon]